MIFIQNPLVTEKEFVSLLSKTREKCLNELVKNNSRALSGVDFENLVCEQMRLAALGTNFESDIEQTGKQAFPDIIAKKYFGIEVKVTKEDKWISVGNSVAEGTRNKKVERIYMFFGKLGGLSQDIKFRKYQDCLSDVGVTHSPRYKIDMDLPKGLSIFDKIKLDYDSLRKEKNPIIKIKAYYRKLLKPGEELWWIDNAPEDVVYSKIEPYRSLEQSLKNNFFLECLVLFPEVLNPVPNQTKYEKVAAYLITKYKAFNSSIRDLFSAGGRGVVIINGRKIKNVPKILLKLYSNATQIYNLLMSFPLEDLTYYWKISTTDRDRLKNWKKLLNANCKWRSKKITAADIFEAGLRNEKKQ